MSNEPIPRMYGITCPNTKNGVHAIRLGKEPLVPNATIADLQSALAAKYAGPNPEVCDKCGANVEFLLDHLRFVDDTEERPYEEVLPSLG